MGREIIKPSKGDEPEPEIALEDKRRRLALREYIEEFGHEFNAQAQEMYGQDGGFRDQMNQEGLQEYLLPGGVYIRELFIPADTIIVTKLWKTERFWIVAYGSALITSELGTEYIEGPHRRVAPYGTRVVLRTYQDTLWFAITATSSGEDLETAHEDVFAEDHSECPDPWDQLPGGDET